MTELLKNFFKGMTTTMDVYPAEPPRIEKSELEDRLGQSFERTGASINQSIEQLELQSECEQSSS